MKTLITLFASLGLIAVAGLFVKIRVAPCCSYSRFMDRVDLGELWSQVEELREKNGRYPASLAEIDAARPHSKYFPNQFYGEYYPPAEAKPSPTTVIGAVERVEERGYATLYGSERQFIPHRSVLHADGTVVHEK